MADVAKPPHIIIQPIHLCSNSAEKTFWNSSGVDNELKRYAQLPDAAVVRKDGFPPTVYLKLTDDCPSTKELKREVQELKESVEILKQEKYEREYRNRFCDLVDIIQKGLHRDLKDNFKNWVDVSSVLDNISDPQASDTEYYYARYVQNQIYAIVAQKYKLSTDEWNALQSMKGKRNREVHSKHTDTLFDDVVKDVENPRVKETEGEKTVSAILKICEELRIQTNKLSERRRKT